jgi:hypothetical protein
LGTLANLAITGGISYGAYRGALYASSNLAVAPIPVRVGVFVGTYAGIYVIRSLFPNATHPQASRAFGNPVLNINIGNFVNNNNGGGGNRFMSVLEYGETLDRSSMFIDGMISLNFIILMMFNILIFVLANRTIIPHIF